MVTTRYSDQQGSKSRQKEMRLYKQWHRPMSKRFIKPPYSMPRVTSIDSDYCRQPTAIVLSNKADKLRSTYRGSIYSKKNLNSLLDLLSIPQSGGKNVKCFGGIIGCKDKTSSWHLNGFPNGSNVESTVQYRGKTHRYAVHRQKTKQKHFST